ncbi:MAG: hypothetical protein Q7T41_04135 [Candidatus Saccharibacteria bacterium]|nr:hypothetical protein [Candidatus Saccharibacteria bacterium]
MSDEKTQTSSEGIAKSDTEPASSEKTTKIKEEKPHKKHRVLKTLSIVFGGLFLVLILIAGWLGFVPGLSNIMGSRTPKDLGVRWTEADYESYKAKTATTFYDFTTAPENPEKPGKKTVFADPKTVQDLQLTQEEITAAINKLGWSWLPAENVQVRLSEGTMEVSGNLKLDHVEDFVNFIGGVGYSESDVSKAADYGRKLVQGGAFYAKGSANVTSNQLNFDLQKIQIGRFNVPMNTASNVIYTGGSNGINNAKHLDVQSATVGNSTLNFTGTYPTTIYVKH